MKGLKAHPVPWVYAVDVSNLAVWLASDEARLHHRRRVAHRRRRHGPYEVPRG
ncbi:hypothetical protein GCM10023215_19990 [Pseudonocardia yuanmonensis]|uniref:Uncharacterized protein n=1 Tax=Pseudonocardia yuanmonensis TaxID=1095914 RepID=A0ABP8W9K5_9PSEU